MTKEDMKLGGRQGGGTLQELEGGMVDGYDQIHCIHIHMQSSTNK